LPRSRYSYLGVRTLRDSFRAAADQAVAAARTRSVRAAFVQGWLSNVLNPKVALFYLTFLPQFISPGDSVCWPSPFCSPRSRRCSGFVAPALRDAIERIGAVVRGARRWLERVEGGALIGLGVRLALDRR
jgi:threonine/homoserine/homoserine lactone efflux protein